MITFKEYLNEIAIKGKAVKGKTFADLAVGDKVTYTFEGKKYTHSVVDVYETQIRVKTRYDVEHIIWMSSKKDKDGKNVWMMYNDPVELINVE